MKMKAPEGMGAAAVEGTAYSVLGTGHLSTDGKKPADVPVAHAVTLAESFGCVPDGEAHGEVLDAVIARSASLASAIEGRKAQREAFATANPHIPADLVDAAFERMLALARR